MLPEFALRDERHYPELVRGGRCPSEDSPTPFSAYSGEGSLGGVVLGACSRGARLTTAVFFREELIAPAPPQL